MTRVPLLLCLCYCGVLAAGCARAQAKVVPEAPPLDVPPPPPRNVEAIEPETPEPMPLPGEPAHTAPSRARLTAPPRSETAKPAEPPKVEAPASDATRVQEEPATKPAGPVTLQTATTEREVEVERGIRSVLARATSALRKINYQGLNVDARTQYDQAKRFISQAEEALRVKNLIFANNLADKAAALATQLGGR